MGKTKKSVWWLAVGLFISVLVGLGLVYLIVKDRSVQTESSSVVTSIFPGMVVETSVGQTLTILEAVSSSKFAFVGNEGQTFAESKQEKEIPLGWFSKEYHHMPATVFPVGKWILQGEDSKLAVHIRVRGNLVMHQSLRDKVTGWIAGFVIFALLGGKWYLSWRK